MSDLKKSQDGNVKNMSNIKKNLDLLVSCEGRQTEHEIPTQAPDTIRFLDVQDTELEKRQRKLSTMKSTAAAKAKKLADARKALEQLEANLANRPDPGPTEPFDRARVRDLTSCRAANSASLFSVYERRTRPCKSGGSSSGGSTLRSANQLA